MPELPEVETTRRGIAPYLEGKRVLDVKIYQPKLRWAIPSDLPELLQGQCIEAIGRRAKYLLFKTAAGTMILHLGMSGRIRILEKWQEKQKHDHVDILFPDNLCMRFTDPRRFGCLLWENENVYQHNLLRHLGIEPLTRDFNGTYLFQQSRKRNVTIKQFIMNNKIVVGVGNIYACEALYLAGIKPTRTAGNISQKRYLMLADAIKSVLKNAIKQGGTTLKDFSSPEGKPGYFRIQLHVYGREHQPCHHCQKPIKRVVIGQRSTYYCANCQS